MLLPHISTCPYNSLLPRVDILWHFLFRLSKSASDDIVKDSLGCPHQQSFLLRKGIWCLLWGPKLTPSCFWVTCTCCYQVLDLTLRTLVAAHFCIFTDNPPLLQMVKLNSSQNVLRQWHIVIKTRAVCYSNKKKRNKPSETGRKP